MTISKHWYLALTSAVMAAATAHAQTMPAKPVAYPAKGQSAQQQASDDGACYSWSKQQTGIDPAMLAQAPPPAQAHGGQRVRGAAGGAAMGAVAGAIGGDAGKGAAIGAATGTVAGGMAHRQERRQAAAVNTQAEAGKDQAMGTYWQAWKACMSGKGYSVQ
ncbi:YMGG-like glycine zipper-containing protein [Cupriavidus pauculus]|uniref:YMGG-like glycine zipper-containing protein n=1 Tax=Cupriavidus pauculus TaxID=82633 RepID=UPI003CC7E15A